MVESAGKEDPVELDSSPTLCSECQSEEIQSSAGKGGSKYDSLGVLIYLYVVPETSILEFDCDIVFQK